MESTQTKNRINKLKPVIGHRIPFVFAKTLYWENYVANFLNPKEKEFVELPFQKLEETKTLVFPRF